MVVLVTGAGGQLGQSLQFIAHKYKQIDFVFCDSKQLDVTNLENCKTVFSKHKPHYCINASAYTAVDKAESEPEKAHLVNVIGPRNLAQASKENNTILVHISTDFVFDGDTSKLSAIAQEKGYSENDSTNPMGVYGQTKLDGEKEIQAILNEHFIVRTSWVYSQFGANFMKTMLRLGAERESLSVVNDQIGTPTHAVDLAEALIAMIQFSNSLSFGEGRREAFGTYNYSNQGVCSWYDFAKQIFENNNIKINLTPIPSASYPTPAKRPNFSLLDKTKIKTTFGIQIPTWQESLKNT
jgi:dTDP-4-dehydrorhamnose reductase